MAKKKKKIFQPTKEIEIIYRRSNKFRKIDVSKKEIVVYNEELNEFQLLSHISASYDENGEVRDG